MCRSEILQTVSLKYKNDTVEVGAYPISHRARDKAHPGQVSMERQPYMLTFTLMAPVTVTALGTHRENVYTGEFERGTFLL